MSDIILLDQETSDQIAAGEVIERPASVVKELVENSIDAQASKIDIEVKGGGMKGIRVVDNGRGMSKENALLSLRRHATSKIKEPADLNNINTLGFRGEALPSIASISRLTLKTRTEESLEGTELVVEGGVIEKNISTGCPPGTDIQVEALFFNTPARRKFMKSSGVEMSKISDIINRLALSYPHISFSLKKEKSQLLKTWGRGDLLEVISLVYGQNKARFFVPVKGGQEDCLIKGYVGSPTLYRSSRKHQSFFVNGRYVKSTLLSRALEEAYSTLLSRNCYPLGVLQIWINPQLIDVNVHPTKIEVKFSQEDYIYQRVLVEVREALKKQNLVPEVTFRKREREGGQVFEQRSLYEGPWNTETKGYREERREEESLPFQEESFPRGKEEEYSSQRKGGGISVLGNFLGTYILAQRDRELLIVDQHAAHERIMYEELKKQVDNGVQYQEIIPLFLEVPSGSEVVIHENRTFWEKLGFSLEKFGGNCFLLRSVPLSLRNIYSPSLIEDIIDSFPQKTDLEQAQEEVIKTMACKASYKANHKITREEGEELLRNLFNCKIPYTCPHGRPTMISLEENQLEKNFKRSIS